MTCTHAPPVPTRAVVGAISPQASSCGTALWRWWVTAHRRRKLPQRGLQPCRWPCWGCMVLCERASRGARSPRRRCPRSMARAATATTAAAVTVRVRGGWGTVAAATAPSATRTCTG